MLTLVVTKPLRHDSLREIVTPSSLHCDTSRLQLPRLHTLKLGDVANVRALEQVAPNLEAAILSLSAQGLLQLLAESQEPEDGQQPQRPLLWSKLKLLSLNMRERAAPLVVRFAAARPRLKLCLNRRPLAHCLKACTPSGHIVEVSRSSHRFETGSLI